MSFFDIAYFAALVVFHGVIGFGPGFMVGLLTGNGLAARDEKTIMQKQVHAIKKADAHNLQWHPSHARWQDKH